MTRLAFCGGAIKDSRQEAAYFGMSIEGQKRRFRPQPAFSGLPLRTDIVRPARLVRLVPTADSCAAANRAL